MLTYAILFVLFIAIMVWVFKWMVGLQNEAEAGPKEESEIIKRHGEMLDEAFRNSPEARSFREQFKSSGDYMGIPLKK